MENFNLKLINFIKEKKWYIIPIVFILMISFTFVIFSPESVPSLSSKPLTPSPLPDSGEEVNPDPVEDQEGLQKKEILPDGTKKYTFNSPTTNRPNITIARGENNDIIFERSIIIQDQGTTKMPEYITAYGQPERIIKGSRFYGPEAELYIWAKKGVAAIANPQTKSLQEIHTFNPMSVDEYIKRFGEDITLEL